MAPPEIKDPKGLPASKIRLAENYSDHRSNPPLRILVMTFPCPCSIQTTATITAEDGPIHVSAVHTEAVVFVLSLLLIYFYENSSENVLYNKADSPLTQSDTNSPWPPFLFG